MRSRIESSSKLNGKRQRPNRRGLNARGFSLMEMIVYAALSTIGIMATMTLMYINAQYFISTKERAEAEDHLLRAEHVLKRTLGQALRVSRNAAVPCAGAGVGCIRDFDSATIPNTGAPQLIHWAHFDREDGTGLGPPANRSRILPTGLYYIPPYSNGTQQFEGVLIADLGVSGTVRPDYGDTFVGNISRLRVFPPVEAATPLNPLRIVSIDVEITIRYFAANREMAGRCYLPNRPSCPSGSVGRDEARRFTILLRNNELGLTQYDGQMERVLGKLYFFKDMIGSIP